MRCNANMQSWVKHSRELWEMMHGELQGELDKEGHWWWGLSTKFTQPLRYPFKICNLLLSFLSFLLYFFKVHVAPQSKFRPLRFTLIFLTPFFNKGSSEFPIGLIKIRDPPPLLLLLFVNFLFFLPFRLYFIVIHDILPIFCWDSRLICSMIFKVKDWSFRGFVYHWICFSFHYYLDSLQPPFSRTSLSAVFSYVVFQEILIPDSMNIFFLFCSSSKWSRTYVLHWTIKVPSSFSCFFYFPCIRTWNPYLFQ